MKAFGKITPLGIIAAFVTLTETTLGYAVTKVDGEVQVALAAFVIFFALLVFSVFCWILWHRANVFYPPSEYGKHTPQEFADAVRPPLSKVVSKQVEFAASVEWDEDAQFAIIDSLLDDLQKQFLILMHLVPCDLLSSEVDEEKGKYEIKYASESTTTGEFDGWMLYSKVKDMALIEVVIKEKKVSLTKSGHRFSVWLIKNNKQALCMKTGYGGWSEPTTH